MDNPYQAGHTLSEADLDMGETYQPKFFSWHGRIGRLRYFGYLILAYIVVTSLVGFLMGLLVVPLTALVGKDNLSLLTGGGCINFYGDGRYHFGETSI